jgi:hypothetical protein
MNSRRREFDRQFYSVLLLRIFAFSAFLGLILLVSLASSLVNCVHWSRTSDFVPEISSGDVSMKTIIMIESTKRRMKMYENNIRFSCFSYLR